jgi:hypothetical protein
LYELTAVWLFVFVVFIGTVFAICLLEGEWGRLGVCLPYSQNMFFTDTVRQTSRYSGAGGCP